MLQSDRSTTEKYRQAMINAGGLMLFAFGLLAVNYSVYIGAWSWAIWACYISMLLIGFGALIKNKTIVESQLIILTLPILFWLIDFCWRAATGSSLWGLTDYLFGDLLPLARLISLEHFFILPLGYLIWSLLPGRPRFAWLIALAQSIAILIASRLLTDPALNVNCAFASCFVFLPTNEYYPFLLLSMTLLSVLAGTALTRAFYYLEKKWYN